MHLFLFVLAILMASNLYAETPPCVSFATAQDVLACALERHPDILRSKADAAYLGSFTQQARQRPNPELDSESTFQNHEDEPAFKLKAAYLHPFELGHKRSARINLAKTRQDSALAQLARTQEVIAVTTVRSLFRMRQIEDELRTVTEALHTFERVIGPYRNRKQLTPEQHVSLNVFTLAQGDYRLRKATLYQEQEELQAFFQLATGSTMEILLPALPLPKMDWPQLTSQTHVISEKSSEKREAFANFQAAQADRRLAAGEAWPDMKLGPMVDVVSGNGKDFTGIGAALSMPIPLYQRNAGGKALAEGALKKSEIHLAERQRELDRHMATLLQRYEASVNALKSIPTVGEMETKHKELESFYERGLVSAPLVIEAHRQMVDFTKSQNEHELRAIESLWSIYALEGRVTEARL